MVMSSKAGWGSLVLGERNSGLRFQHLESVNILAILPSKISFKVDY